MWQRKLLTSWKSGSRERRDRKSALVISSFFLFFPAYGMVPFIFSVV
jgi:hypothetical protein